MKAGYRDEPRAPLIYPGPFGCFLDRRADLLVDFETALERFETDPDPAVARRNEVLAWRCARVLKGEVLHDGV